MTIRTLVALAAAALTGMSTAAALAQERPLGHESAVGPRGMVGREAPAPARPAGPPPAPMAPAVRPGPGVGPAPVPQGPAMGPRPMAEAPQRPMMQAPQRPMVQAPQRPMVQAPQQPMVQAPQRPIQPAQQQPVQPVPRTPVQQNHGPVGAPRFGHQPPQNMAPQVAPAAPNNRAPRAVGAVPAPFHGNMRHFVDQDARVWQGGRWHHDRHGGRDGWWWVVGGLWYFYPQPVYPYPDPFIPGEVIYTYGPSASGSYWYYCASAGQYYPYVTYCPEGWQPVIPSDSDDFQDSDD